MKKPDFLSDAEWAHVRDQTSSLDRIRSDGRADVADYLANPDGRAIVQQGGSSPYLQRKNGNDTLGSCAVPPTSTNQFGVDLNRNAPVDWGVSSSSTQPCAATYRGSEPSSEP